MDASVNTPPEELGHFKLIFDWNATMTDYFIGSVLEWDTPVCLNLLNPIDRIVSQAYVAYHEICNGHFLLEN